VADPRVIFRKGSPKRKVPDRADQVKSPDWLWGREEWYNDRPDPRGVINFRDYGLSLVWEGSNDRE